MNTAAALGTATPENGADSRSSVRAITCLPGDELELVIIAALRESDWLPFSVLFHNLTPYVDPSGPYAISSAENVYHWHGLSEEVATTIALMLNEGKCLATIAPPRVYGVLKPDRLRRLSTLHRSRAYLPPWPITSRPDFAHPFPVWAPVALRPRGATRIGAFRPPFRVEDPNSRTINGRAGAEYPNDWVVERDAGLVDAQRLSGERVDDRSCEVEQ